MMLNSSWAEKDLKWKKGQAIWACFVLIIEFDGLKHCLITKSQFFSHAHTVFKVTELYSKTKYFYSQLLIIYK